MSAVLVLAVLFLAYTNGSNDTFKGVATLYGSRTASYGKALAWATATTFAGALVATWFGSELVKQFSGKGLVPDDVTVLPSFLLAVGLGAALTVIAATLLAFPVSTTHALTGALTGAGAVFAGSRLDPKPLLAAFVLPLVASPLISLAATVVLYPVFRAARRAARVEEETCLCVGQGEAFVPVPAGTKLALVPGSTVAPSSEHAAFLRPLEVSVGTEAVCVRRYKGALIGISAQRALDVVHFLSAGAVSFARGLNDAPKIVALLVTAKAFALAPGLALVAVAMAVGGLLHSRKIARTMGTSITDMNAGQAFSGNLVTALLVTTASWSGLPVSTTHVSCGALFGIGAVTGEGRTSVIVRIVLAWVTTLPLAALLAAGVAALAR